MTEAMQRAAEEFVSSLEATPVLTGFRAARKEFDENQEVLELRRRLSELSSGYQRKQANNTVTEEDIALLRAAQNSLSNHPVVIRFGYSRQALVLTFRSCDQAISEELGFEFATLAAPASCCG